MPTYDYRCDNCEIVIEEFRKYEDRDTPAECMMCKGPMNKTWVTMPGITRASYIDSGKTSRAKDLHDLKEVAKLEVQKANLPPDKRGEINKEIKERSKLK